VRSLAIVTVAVRSISREYVTRTSAVVGAVVGSVVGAIEGAEVVSTVGKEVGSCVGAPVDTQDTEDVASATKPSLHSHVYEELSALSAHRVVVVSQPLSGKEQPVGVGKCVGMRLGGGVAA